VEITSIMTEQQYYDNTRQRSAELRPRSAKLAPVTVIVPAYNEENTIDLTLTNLLCQSSRAESIIVVDDFSSDRTGDIARSYQGVKVVRPPKNTGSKAGAQSFALPLVDTEYTIAIDADTVLEEDAIEKMVKFMGDHPETSAASTFVMPQRIRTIWERGRYIEYLYAFVYYKRVQEWYERPLISSGCFSIYRTDDLKKLGGWSDRTMAEDMDLTWTFYEQGRSVRFNHEVHCYPIEPENFTLMVKQLKRWSHGWAQNLRLHWQGIKRIPVLREIVATSLIDMLFGGLIYFFFAPLIAILTGNPIVFLYALFADTVFVSIPALIKGFKIKSLRQVIISLPCFFVLRTLNSIMLYKAFISEFVFRKSFHVYEKGH
jgi:cellulose synthase/poly-beta-1,6-N-acetylglucosamine synthase-like glycosyltransferase